MPANKVDVRILNSRPIDGYLIAVDCDRIHVIRPEQIDNIPQVRAAIDDNPTRNFRLSSAQVDGDVFSNTVGADHLYL